MITDALARAWYAGETDSLLDSLDAQERAAAEDALRKFDTQHYWAEFTTKAWIEDYISMHEDFSRKDFVISAQIYLPRYWQLAIDEHFSGGADYRAWTVKTLSSEKLP